MSTDSHVACRTDAHGWLCDVVTPAGTRHEVLVPQPELDDLAPGSADPTGVVAESFAFLLEREPASAILPRFSLADIETYFPDYRSVIRSRIVR